MMRSGWWGVKLLNFFRYPRNVTTLMISNNKKLTEEYRADDQSIRFRLLPWNKDFLFAGSGGSPDLLSNKYSD
jgi:hypothetical protein